MAVVGEVLEVVGACLILAGLACLGWAWLCRRGGGAR